MSSSKERLITVIEELLKEAISAKGIIDNIWYALMPFHVSEKPGSGLVIDLSEGPQSKIVDIQKFIKNIKTSLKQVKKQYASKFPKEFSNLSAEDLDSYSCFPSLRLLGSTDIMVRLERTSKSLGARIENLKEKKKKVQGTVSKSLGTVRAALEVFSNGFLESYIDNQTTEDILEAKYQLEVAQRNSYVGDRHARVSKYTLELCKVNKEREKLGLEPLDALIYYPDQEARGIYETLNFTMNLTLLPAAEYAFNKAADALRLAKYPKGVVKYCDSRYDDRDICGQLLAKAREEEAKKNKELDKKAKEAKLQETNDEINRRENAAANSPIAQFTEKLKVIDNLAARLGGTGVSADGKNYSISLQETVEDIRGSLRVGYDTASKKEQMALISSAASKYIGILNSCLELYERDYDDFRLKVISDIGVIEKARIRPF